MILGVIFRYGTLVLNIFYSSMLSVDTAQDSIDALHLAAADRTVENIDFVSVFTNTTITPMVEEFVYRGCILGCLLSRYNVSRSILLSAIIFGAFHGDGFFSAFLGGVFLAAIYVIYKNIFLCTAVHGVVNLFVFFSPGLIVKITPFYYTDLQKFPLFGFSLLPAFMVILFIVLLLTYFLNRRESSPFPPKMTKNHQPSISP
ncbi:MAG: CPBP family intramembrane metalloprotease [Gammaproteobacteria bacterium]|nr:CPBP family intramembrane metalloprotease [Gammaproteobacteria bacterium]